MLKAKRKKDLFNSPAGRVFDVFNYILMGIFGFATLSPFIYVVAGSFATELELTTRSFFLIPREVTLEAYRYIFQTGTVINGIIRTVGVKWQSRRHDQCTFLNPSFIGKDHTRFNKGIIIFPNDIAFLHFQYGTHFISPPYSTSI